MGQYLSRTSGWQFSAPSAPARAGAERSWSNGESARALALHDSDAQDCTGTPSSSPREGYRGKGMSGTALVATLVVHVLGALILLNLGVVGARDTSQKRLAVFDVQTRKPSPPPPAPPPPKVEQAIVSESPPARITAPRAMIALIDQRPAAPPKIEARPVAAVEIDAPAAPSQQAAPAPITPPDFLAAQLSNPGPEYPFQSRRDREQGVALLKVLVTPEGRAGEVRIERSSGYSRLDRAALKTVRHWRFVPAKQAGVAVAAWVLVPVGFSLS